MIAIFAFRTWYEKITKASLWWSYVIFFRRVPTYDSSASLIITSDKKLWQKSLKIVEQLLSEMFDQLLAEMDLRHFQTSLN